MRRSMILLPLLLVACSTSTSETKGPSKNGCATAEKAFSAYDDMRKAVQDGTSTIPDTIGYLKTIKEKMEAVGTIAGPELAKHADAAALSAGRMRVALSGGSANVSAETANLGTEITAASTYCHA